MVRTADAVTRLVCRVSTLESELAVERQKRRQAEAQAAGLRGVVARLREQQEKPREAKNAAR
jgi:hypothetical protein